MKRLLIFLSAMLLVWGMVASAGAVNVTFTYTSDNVVSAWFKDGAAPVEIVGTTVNHDLWRNATTNTIALTPAGEWEIIWLNVNSDHDAGWSAPAQDNPGGFLGQVTGSYFQMLNGDNINKILTGNLYWEVARINDFFVLEDGWGTTNTSTPTLAQLQAVYDERPTAADWASLNWVAATEWGTNGVAPWGTIAGIDSQAKWIWTAENFAQVGAPDIDDAVFVRVRFKVPEPFTMLLLGFGLLSLAGIRRKYS